MAIVLAGTPPATALATQADAAQVAAPGARIVTSLDATWRFRREDVAQAAQPDFDDTDWVDVTLPHTFNGGDGDDGGGYYRGVGWYRRMLDIASVPQGRRVWIEFDGAALATDLYVNGRSIGRHEGGHARFRFDVTAALKPGANVIAVRVENSRLPAISPLGGDFTVFGGLYRHVSLVETGEVHIDLADHGGPGVYLKTQSLDDRAARIGAQVRVRNDTARRSGFELAVTVRDAAGVVVAAGRRRLPIAVGATIEPTIALTIANPHRWNGVADPYLYAVEVEVRAAGRVTDRTTTAMGLRTTAIDPERGFLLNGRPYPLRGVNLFHSGRPGRGLAATDAEIAEDVQIFQDMGATALRFVHFQHPQAAYEEADRRGLIVWTEIGLNGAIDDGAPFEANVRTQMRELIRQNVNHPSIALWGIGNEVYAVSPAVTRVLKAAHDTARAEDQSRPTIYAHCCQADDHEKARITDVIGFNRYFGWYPGQDDTIGGWADRFHAANPSRALAIGEYGAGASIRHQQVPPPAVNVPVSGWHPEQAQTAYHESNWRELATRKYLFGTFIWVGFDLASDGRREGDRPGINDKGIVSYDRAVRKDSYYFYQAHWSAKPMVHIVDRRLTQRTERDVTIRAFSNAAHATLTLNGQPAGEVAVVDRVATWPVRLAPGANVLSVAAGAANDTVRITWAPPSTLGVSPIPRVRTPAAPAVAPPKAPPGQE